MKACDVHRMIETIRRHKIQTTKTIRTLKHKLQAGRVIKQNLAITLTEKPHFLNYAISAELLNNEDEFDNKGINIIATLEEEINESIAKLNKVASNLPVK
ncbi:unnamed protein product [Lactuca virosa]|uniref:Uncharacterized protein n=1 Tax=Lactuca virosa TaxID=75947 RepID=A0AAU9MVG4_9ASTR|nr:unnamed protein product [Lactuca virosa]